MGVHAIRGLRGRGELAQVSLGCEAQVRHGQATIGCKAQVRHGQATMGCEAQVRHGQVTMGCKAQSRCTQASAKGAALGCRNTRKRGARGHRRKPGVLVGTPTLAAC